MKEEDLLNYKIDDIVVPLTGTEVKYKQQHFLKQKIIPLLYFARIPEGNIIQTLIEETLAEDGLSLNDLKLPEK